MSLDMWEAIGVAIDRLTADDDVRVIVLRGAGGAAFVSGADISQFEQQRSSPETVAALRRGRGHGEPRARHDTHKPTIAMIEGYCIGGGVGIAITLRHAHRGGRARNSASPRPASVWATGRPACGN